MKSEEVKKIQKALVAKGYDLKVDGILGPITQKALDQEKSKADKPADKQKAKPLSTGDQINSVFRSATKGIVPTNFRMFSESLTGSELPVNESDLTKKELARLREIVRKNLKKGKKTITYDDYTDSPDTYGDKAAGNTSKATLSNSKSNPDYNLRTMIGQAGISVSSGDTLVLDRYNFNDAPIGKRSFADKIKEFRNDPYESNSGSLYNTMRNVGKHFGPGEGKGMPVRISTSQRANPVRDNQIAQESVRVAGKIRPGVSLKMSGGQIGSMVGAATNLFAPGIGSAITPILTQLGSAIEEGISGNKLQLGQNTNPYGYELGGKLQNSGMGPGMALYKGREHRTGGIMVMPSGVPSPKGEKSNVEDEEVLVQLGKLGNHIFSKKLKVQ